MKRSLMARLWPNATALVLFVVFAFPVYWMFATSLKPAGDIIADDPVFLPTDITFDHFQKALDADHFWTLVGNSLTVTVLAVVFSSSSRCSRPSRWPGCGSRAVADSS